MHKPITFQRESDLPSMPVSLGTMLWNKTGSWRYIRPVYERHTPPCNHACPAGEQVQGYLALAAAGDFAAAWRLLREDNPFPGVCGRVCDHPCETACNRESFDQPLAVHLVERFLADWAADSGVTPAKPIVERRLERVAVIGAGPAGLSCAYHLARRGYGVTVFEAAPEPGGMLRFGIPRYRLPRDVLDREIAAIEALGVAIKTGRRAGRDFGLDDLRDYAAAFIATGAHAERMLGIPGEDLPGVLSGLAFLRSANLGRPVALGSRLAIVGGGNTAVDVARVALRLGAQVTLLYRRQGNAMPAIADEVAAAEAEGVAIRCLVLPERIVATPDGLTIECLAAQPGPPDESGRPRPLPVPGSTFALAVDTVIKAIGEDTDLGFLPAGHAPAAAPAAGAFLGDGPAGGNLFLGGDAAVPASRRRVAMAIGAGKHAAVAIDTHLRGASTDTAGPPWVVTPDKLNRDYFLPAPRVTQPVLAPATRRGSFAEINGGIDSAAAATEAGRCFSCGVCTHCDVCWAFCPDIAIVRRADRSGYDINYDYCKGCGICVAECPRAAMAVAEERYEESVVGGAP